MSKQDTKEPRVLAEYALYKGEELLAVGTAKEISEEMGVHKNLVYDWASRKRHHTGNRRFAVRIN